MIKNCGYSYGKDAWLKPCYDPDFYFSFDNLTNDVSTGRLSVHGPSVAEGLVCIVIYD